MTTIEGIEQVCKEVQDLLTKKNKAYGDSVANPLQVFSRLSPGERIKVRIDDKLCRIVNGIDKDAVSEDTELDLIGYLIIKRVLELQARESI